MFVFCFVFLFTFTSKVVNSIIFSLWLKECSKNKHILLFCVIIAILFFLTNVAINIIMFFLVYCFDFLRLSGYFVL